MTRTRNSRKLCTKITIRALRRPRPQKPALVPRTDIEDADPVIRYTKPPSTLTVFAVEVAVREQMKAAGIPVAAGTMIYLVGSTSCPETRGRRSKDRYQAAGVKVIWHGGEEHEFTGYSFCA